MNLKNAFIENVSTRKDGSLKIVLSTRELPPEEMARIFLGINKEMVSIDIPDDISEEKTPSARLRWVLYHVWDKHHKDKYQTFTLYYNHILEQLIEKFKEKID